jgi:hypothetical protein
MFLCGVLTARCFCLLSEGVARRDTSAAAASDVQAPQNGRQQQHAEVGQPATSVSQQQHEQQQQEHVDVAVARFVAGAQEFRQRKVQLGRQQGGRHHFSNLLGR